MNINDELLKKLQNLASIEIQPNNLETTKANLNEIVHFVENINKLDLDKNEVIVGEEKYIFKDNLYVKDLNMLVPITEKSVNVKAKIRYSAKEADAQLIHRDENTAEVVFNSPQRAITPGQSIVFYDDDGVVLGGGKIQ